jgi:hypothetical protein
MIPFSECTVVRDGRQKVVCTWILTQYPAVMGSCAARLICVVGNGTLCTFAGSRGADRLRAGPHGTWESSIATSAASTPAYTGESRRSLAASSPEQVPQLTREPYIYGDKVSV